jgi:short-subunit dehydrogenase
MSDQGRERQNERPRPLAAEASERGRARLGRLSHVDHSSSWRDACIVTKNTANGSKRVLIVGSSDGIGLALARRLLAAGSFVAGVSRSATSLRAPSYVHEVLDVTAPGYIDRLRGLLAAHGPFETCVYCAGIGEELDLEHLERERQVFEVNLLGALRTAEVLVPTMTAAGHGHLVVLSSQADELISPEAPSYSASKAAMTNYFEGLALALRAKGVAVSVVRFGFVDTKMARAAVRPFMMSVERAARLVERVMRRRPIRLTRPLRMASLVCVLRWLRSWQLLTLRVR